MFGDDEDEVLDENETTIAIRPETCGVLQFHNGTEEAMFIYIQQKAQHGDANNIIKSIDEFCYLRHWMMHIGDSKSKYLENIVIQVQTQCNLLHCSAICVELGSYCGYSAIRMARLLGANSLLICIENEIKCVDWTRRLVAYAGLDDKVIVLHGTVESVITDGLLRQTISNYHQYRHILNSNKDNNDDTNITINPNSKASAATIDLLFIDHDKASYRTDLELIVSHNFLSSGSIVVADNILSFNQPLNDYLEYVKNENGPFCSSITHQDVLEYSSSTAINISQLSTINNSDISFIDAVEISIFR